MSFYNLSSYYFKSVEEPLNATGRCVFDATKSNYRNGNVPEIGSTIYNTIPTDDDAFVDASSDSKESKRKTRARSTRRRARLPKNETFSDSIRRRRRMKTRRNEEVDDENSPYADFIMRHSCKRRSDDYHGDVFRSAKKHKIERCKSSRRKLGIPLYDATDDSSFSLWNADVKDESTLGRSTSTSLSVAERRMQRESAPKWTTGGMFPVITEQCIRVTSTTRQSWLHSTIYIFSATEMGHCDIAQLDRMLTNTPVMNHETNEMELDRRSLNLKEDIFVKNNIIKIRRSALFHDLQNGNQVEASGRHTYNNLCPAEVTNAAQREVYGNVALRPESVLNVVSTYSSQRSGNGDVRLIEKLIITLSSGKEPQATQRLQKQVEERIIEPEDYDIPVQYTEEVLIGPRRIDITRETEIKPQEGLNEFMTVAKPQLFEFGEVRRYRNFVLPTSQGPQSDHPIQRSSTPPSPLIDGHTQETTPRQSSFREFEQAKSPKVTEKDEKEQISAHKIQSEKQTMIREVSACGVPVINGISESPVSIKQKLEENGKYEKTDSRLKTRGLTRGLRRSSRWSRFALSKPENHPSSIEFIRTVPATFSPLKASTPIRKSPKTGVKGLDERSKFPVEEFVKTSRSQSSGTGTHIRSTLDCDITLTTTKEVNVTEIPIEIKGALNGLPWCTTIRLRIKHDANEKPTFVPNRLLLNHNVLWQSENLQSEQSKEPGSGAAVKKQILW
ncbi:unnamed protein product [Litomosoides sigmodontis]|uniref:Uncharacterized protein n=1 Tax=Litomosoides sigmodontis TaxID=42156 RepID=A0A3P6SJJ7_LITSI|nr:unnamed protein product [Litomosoides sigmodontis]